MVANDERSTDLIFRTLRNTARVAKNAVSDEVAAGPGRRRRASRTSASSSPAPAARTVYETGDLEAGIWWAGQVQG